MAERDLTGRTLGEFELLEQIGQGGFAAVYRSEQSRLKRQAAVKVLHARHQSAIALERFEQEAQLSSLLDHEYIAHIYNFRAEDDGTLWIAMELVRGITLSDWFKKHGPMTLEQFVPFFEHIADAVHEAHKRGIVHRDLKPSNVMVIERRRGRPLPKLLDFGIAHVDQEVAFAGSPAATTRRTLDESSTSDGGMLLDASNADAPTDSSSVELPYRFTRTGARLGSAPYMSPEQWYDASAVGPASDIYSLGVLAYQALTGKVPFTAATSGEYYELHRDAEVPSLGDRGTPELDRIIRRALAKSPKHRYGSVLELADDFGAALRASEREQLRTAAQQWAARGRSPGMLWTGGVLAELNRWSSRRTSAPLSQLECSFVAASQRRARRAGWIRRTVLLLAAVAALGAFQYRASERLRMAEQSALEAEGEQGRQALLHGESNEAVHHLERAYRAGDHSPGTEFMLARALQPRMSELGRLPSSSGRMWSAVFSPDGKRVITTDDDGARMWDAGSNQVLFSMRHGDTVYDAGYSPDGSRVVTAGADGTVGVWDASTGAAIHRLSWPGLEREMRYYKVVAATRFVAAIDWKGHATHIWDLGTGAAVAQLENEASEAASLALSADERWLATSGGEVVRVFDTSTWKLAVTIAGPRVRSLAFESSGTRLAVGTYDGEASIWEVPSGVRVRHLRQLGRPVDAIGFSGNGELVAAGSRDGGVQVWDASSGALWSQATPHRGQVHRVEFSPKGDLLLSAGADGSVVISNVATGQPIDRLEGPKDVVFAAHFDASARRVVGASWDGTARLWEVAPPYHRWGTPPVGPECDTADSLEPDRRFIAFSCGSRRTRAWDTVRGELLAELPGATAAPGDYFSALPAVTRSGDRAAVARGNAVEVYALPSGQLIRTITHPAAVNAVAFAVDGHDLVSGSIDGSLFVTADGHDQVALPTSLAGIDAVAMMPDGHVVAADAGARLRIIDPKRNVVLMDLGAPSRVRLLRLSPDGRRLVTISVRSKQTPPILWDLDAGRVLTQLRGHVGRVFSARFVADGRQVLTAGRDGTARLWSATTGSPLQTFRGDAAFLADAALSPDRAIVVAGGGDGVLRFWEAATGRLLWKLQAHTSYIVGVHYEGSDIVTRGIEGDVSRWTLPESHVVIETCHANGCASTPGTGQ